MKLGIKVSELENEPGYIAEVDWSKGDAGQVGTPGGIKYGEAETEAYDRLKELLQQKGHTIIETAKQLCYSDNVTPCDCPGLCREK